MESKLLNLFFPKKRDIHFEVAMNAIDSIKGLFALKNEEISQENYDSAIFHKIFPKDEGSPYIYFFDKNEYVIYYPPYSTPYNHKFKDKCKFIEVLSGVVYDKNSERKLLKGDKIKIDPNDNYIPYTLDQKCVLRVCVADCKNDFGSVCK